MLERTDEIYKILKNRAISYAFPPGQRILLDPLVDELGATKHQVRQSLLRLVSEGWVIQAPRKGFLSVSLSATTIAEYYEVNRSLLDSALCAAESGQPIRQSVSARIDKIFQTLSAFKGNDETLATLIGQLFSAVAAQGGNRVTVQLVELCNEHLYFIRSRECLYLDGLDTELLGLCELAVDRRFTELRQAIIEYHTRRNRLTSNQLRLLSAKQEGTKRERIDSRYH